MSIKSICAGFGILIASAGMVSAATLVNGSLTGAVANGIVPTGWTSLVGSPDTMDENNNVGVASVPFFTSPSGPSPDGGTWVGFGNDRVNAFEEVFGQMISDFVAGRKYSLSWFAANFGADTTGFQGPCFCGPNSIFASLDGTVIGMGTDLSSDSEWIKQSITFTATDSAHMLAFGQTKDGPSYLSIDGISLTAVSPVPVPAGLALVLSGVGAFGIMRRRRKS